MARQLDQILVIDVESTCWEGNPPPGEMSEIIEIGLCTLDWRTLERLEKRSILVAPERSTVSDFCTQLTTLTQQDVSAGVSLQEACNILRREYAAKDRLWASWGDYDRSQFERVCTALNIKYPFGKTHLNVKSLFAATAGLKREIGIDGAFKMLDWELEGTHHRGHDDAWNIARVLRELFVIGRAGLNGNQE